MAATLRRRAAGGDTPSPSDTPTPRDRSPAKARQKRHDLELQTAKTRKRKTTAIFLLGSLFGIIAAGFFAKSNDLIDFPEIGELSMDSLFEVLPAGLVKDMRDLVASSPYQFPPGCRLPPRCVFIDFATSRRESAKSPKVMNPFR